MLEKAKVQSSDNDFERICRTMMETERGRGFLAEIVRRFGNSDAWQIQNKLDRILASLGEAKTSENADEPVRLIKGQLQEISASIQEARQEILAIKPRQSSAENLSAATEELDAIVDSTEKATTDILSSAEALQDHASKLREMGVEEAICDDIESHATNIFMACSFQDITGQRTTKVMHAIRGLDQRVKSMIQMWQDHNPEKAELVMARPDDPRPDAHLLNGPQLDGQGKSQDEIDKLLNQQIDELEREAEYEKNLDALKAMSAAASSAMADPSPPGEAEPHDTADSGGEIAQDDIDALFDDDVA